MEKKDYYTLKEIILGLRSEYINHRKEMDILKQFSKCDDKRVLDYYFRALSSTHGDKNEKHIVSNYKYKHPNLEFFKNKSRKMYGIYYPKYSDIDSPIYKINITDKEKFDLQCDKILNSDIVNNNSEISSKKIDGFLNINNNEIEYFKNWDKFDTQYSIIYSAYKDYLYIKRYDEEQGIYTPIKQIFDTKICSDVLSEYHKNLIDNSKDTKKEFRLLNYIDNDKEMNFSIEEKIDNELWLTKVKKLKR